MVVLRRPEGATSQRCAQLRPLSLRRKRASPVAFPPRRPAAPRRWPSLVLLLFLSPSKEKTSLPRSGRCRRSARRRRLRPLHSIFSERVDDARQRIQERGRLVGKARRDSPEAVLHDAFRDEEKVRERAEKRPLERGRAEVLPPATAVLAAPAGAGHCGGHTLPGLEGRSRAHRLDDPRELVSRA